MRVKYCLTNLMLEEYFMNPLMGKISKELRYVLMGDKSILEIEPNVLSSIKEHVGNHLKYSD